MRRVGATMTRDERQVLNLRGSSASNRFFQGLCKSGKEKEGLMLRWFEDLFSKTRRRRLLARLVSFRRGFSTIRSSLQTDCAPQWPSFHAVFSIYAPVSTAPARENLS